MPAPTPVRMHGIKDFMFGSDQYGTIKEVSTNEESTPLYDAGDVDKDEVLVGEGVSRNSFTVTLSDAIQAEAIKAHAAATITFKGVNAADSAVITCTMTNCRIFGRSGRAGHSMVAGITLTGRADNITYAASA